MKPAPEPLARPAAPRPAADRLTTGLLLVAIAFLLLVRVGEAPISRRAELRTHAVATEMASGSNWLIPRMNGEPRLEKPPLYYWAAASAMRIGNGSGTFELRLPSLAAAIGLLVVTYLFGRSIGGPALGLGAVTALGTSYLFLRFGRRGVADMPLALFTTVALFEYHRIRFLGEGNRWIFAAAIVLAFFAKATAALLVIFLPIVAFEVLERRRDRRDGASSNARRTPVFTPGWIAWVLLGCASWYAAVALTLPGAIDAFREALLVPAGLASDSASAQHREPPWYFLPQFLRVAAPATLLLPWVVTRAWQTRLWREQPELRFVALVFVTTFVAFSILPQKQRHYLLPVMPFFAILVAHCARSIAEARPQSMWRLFRVATPPLAILGCLFSIFAFFYLREVERSATTLAILVATGGLLASTALVRAAFKQMPRTLLVQAVALTVLPYSLFVGSLSVWQGRFRSGELEAVPGFEAAHWEGVFDRYPFAIETFRADDWLEGERSRFEREARER